MTWRRGPSSGKSGYKAIVHPDGSVEGWLGGACAEPTVVRIALEALTDGAPRLVVLGEPESRPGVLAVSMACSSEGAMEVFVEPVLPVPQLWVIGESPAVSMLVDLAETLGWQTRQVGLDLDLTGVTASSMIVIATQGHYDEPAVQAALRTGSGYVGLVASQKRAGAVRVFLRESGVDDEQLSRLRAPAGLDLGATEHHEIAVAILAELVALRSLTPVPVPGAPPPDPRYGRDPVCGMTVSVATAAFSSDHGGTTVYFCAAGCKRAFDTDPAAFPLAPEITPESAPEAAPEAAQE